MPALIWGYEPTTKTWIPIKVDSEGVVQVYDPILGLTTFEQETAPATDVNGVTWKDLLDKSVLTKPEEIWQITLTIAGGWAGNCQIRFVDGADNKIFPFGAQAVQGTDFFSGVPWAFPAPITVPVSSGYKLQFRSSNAGDGAGQTCQLNELAVIQRG